MKFNSRQEAAYMVATVSALATLGIMYSLLFVLDASFAWWAPLPVAVINFSIVYFVSVWVVERFVYEKIKVIYRIIQGRGSDFARDQPELEEVQTQAEDWAEKRQSEIQTLKQQADFRRDFIGNLAHELRTPLFSVQGYMDTLLDGGIEDEKINYDYLRRADKNLERLTALVKDLNAISNIESGREQMNIEEFNIVELADETISLSELRAKKKSISLQLSKAYDKPIMVSADKDKIGQVLTNLVINAIHYGRENGYCKIRFSDMPNHILIQVMDDGVGIEKDEMPRLFERFYRVDKSRSRNEGGTGLGLAIVKHIVESHSQTVNVHSEWGKGSTFSFTLAKP